MGGLCALRVLRPRRSLQCRGHALCNSFMCCQILASIQHQSGGTGIQEFGLNSSKSMPHVVNRLVSSCQASEVPEEDCSSDMDRWARVVSLQCTASEFEVGAGFKGHKKDKK